MKKIYTAFLTQTDEMAKSKPAGPFAARMDVVDPMTKQHWNIAKTLWCPLSTAEDKLLSASIINAVLQRIAASPHGVVVVTANVQPCAESHAKLEMLARRLVYDQKIANQRFRVVYGADLNELAEMRPEFDDTDSYADMRRQRKNRRVSFRQIAFHRFPAVARHVLQDKKDAAIVNSDGAVVATARHGNDGILTLAQTAELKAIQDAKKHQAETDKTKNPWDLSGMSLYTKSRKLGPASYAAAQWTGVNLVFSSTSMIQDGTQRENIAVSNSVFYGIIARGPQSSRFVEYIRIDDPTIGRSALQPPSPA